MSFEIHHGDCLEVMKELPDNSVDLIATDPPYFKVKGEDWDNQWDKPDKFLEWIGALSEQWHRILKPNGSLYVFASPQMAARVEVELSKGFNILSHISWSKPSGRFNQANKDGLRAFFPQTEKIIFAEHYGSDNIAKGEAGYSAKCDELRGFLFEPLRAYIAGEFERAGMLTQAGKIAANVACGFSASAGGMASRHYFSRSQWQLPTREHYNALRRLLNESGGDYLKREYDDLKREYDDLKREYDDLRRPFNVSNDAPFTDVWTFNIVPGYKGRHVCEKPLDLMEHIIKASSKEGGTVLDCFCGSGSTGVAAVKSGRQFIGIEKDAGWVEKARVRIENEAQQLQMAV